MNKKNWIGLSIISILLLSLAITFFFTDLEISKSLYDATPSFYVVLVAAIGEFPIYIGPILFGLVYGFTSDGKYKKFSFHLIGLIASYIATIRLSKGVFKYLLSAKMGLVEFALLALVALIIYVLLFMLFNQIKQEKLDKLRDITLIYLIVSLSSFLIVSGIKLIWGRPRFRILTENYSEYSNFLTIHGFSNSSLGDDYRSFPSGHTNSAASILLLSLIPMKFTSKKWIKYLVFSLCFIYTISVAISRIRIGAHYASDVLFGFGISITCFFITCLVFKKKGWLHDRSN